MADAHKGFLWTMAQECNVLADGSFDDATITDTDGGLTRLGVDSRSHPHAVTDGFYQMSKFDALNYAERIYTACYWDLVSGSSIESQMVASKYADLAFNSGINEATKIVQRAVNSCRQVRDLIMVDGIPGWRTTAAVNAVDANRLMAAIIGFGETFYQELYRAHTAIFSSSILNGWLRRLDRIPG
jgi:lysozyme family protein